MNQNETLLKLKDQIEELFESGGYENSLANMKYIFLRAMENDKNGRLTEPNKSDLTNFWIDLNNLLHTLNTFNKQQKELVE
jgi:hypothetical protein